jgi:hypothetical protein
MPKTAKKRTRQRPRRYIKKYTNDLRNEVKLYINGFEKRRKRLAKPKYKNPRTITAPTLIPKSNNISALGLYLKNKDLIDRTHIAPLIIPSTTVKASVIEKQADKAIVVKEATQGEPKETVVANVQTEPEKRALDFSLYRLHRADISKPYLIQVAESMGLPSEGNKDELVRRIAETKGVDSKQSLEFFESDLYNNYRSFKTTGVGTRPANVPPPSSTRAVMGATPSPAPPRRLAPLTDISVPPKTPMSDSEAYDVAFPEARRSIPPLRWGYAPLPPKRVTVVPATDEILEDLLLETEESEDEKKDGQPRGISVETQKEDEKVKRPRPPVAQTPLPTRRRQSKPTQKGQGHDQHGYNAYTKYSIIQPLYDSQISEIMKPYRSKGFLGVFASDEIDQVKQAVNKADEMGFIMNLDKASGEGTHWVAVYCDFINQKEICYYDSFGDEPTDDFLYRLKKIVQARKDLKYYLKLKINMIKTQRANSSTCGYLSMGFLMDMFDGKSFKEASHFNELKDESAITEGEKSVKKRFGYLLA